MERVKFDIEFEYMTLMVIREFRFEEFELMEHSLH